MFRIKKLLVIIIILLFSVSNPVKVCAWSQEAHEQINTEAIKAFGSNYGSSGKYINSPVDWGRQLNGPGVLNSGLIESTFGYMDLAAATWVSHGGYSADEPNLYASLRHFFDPLQINGQYFLTDMPYVGIETIANATVNPEIDARWWALSHEENAFSFRNGLEYYKKSMEILVGLTDNDGYKTVPKNFREGESRNLLSDDEVRGYFLSKSLRALGETMHLVGDMTQPAHVRNDEHKNGDPIEDSVDKTAVKRWASGKPASSVVFASSPIQLFYNIAEFTNRDFYSNDTIFDKDTEIMPNNGLIPYPSPQFKDMTREKGNIKYKDVGGMEVPMAARTLSSYIYGIDDEESYMIPTSFTQLQAKVLVPVAIKGCESLMDSFFPTLSLDLTYESALAAVQDKGTINAYQLKGNMLHHMDNDPAWKEYGLQIKYCGEAEIVKKAGNKEEVLAYVEFLDGALAGYKLEKEGKYRLIEPIIIVMDDGTESTDKYLVISSKDEIFLKAEAGGRTITSNTLSFINPQITIDPSTASIEEGTQLQFDLDVKNGPEKPWFKWSFSDGTPDVEGEQLSISHVFKNTGENDVTVVLLDEEDKSTVLAQEHAYISVLPKESEPGSEEPEDVPSPSTTSEPEPTTSPEPAQTEPPVEEYDYQAALAAWAADFAAEVNSRKYDNGICKTTEEFEWVMQPFIKDGQVLGASRIWGTNAYYAGEFEGKTFRSTVNEAYDANNPGFYISVGDLEQKYPQFKSVKP